MLDYMIRPYYRVIVRSEQYNTLEEKSASKYCVFVMYVCFMGTNLILNFFYEKHRVKIDHTFMESAVMQRLLKY